MLIEYRNRWSHNQFMGAQSIQKYRSDRNLFFALALFVVGVLVVVGGGVSALSSWAVGAVMLLLGVALCYLGAKVMRDNHNRPSRAA
jgi:drug/metabolite transporter (DMT)-like permease